MFDFILFNVFFDFFPSDIFSLCLSDTCLASLSYLSSFIGIYAIINVHRAQMQYQPKDMKANDKINVTAFYYRSFYQKTNDA
jgi:hypothetical protein